MKNSETAIQEMLQQEIGKIPSEHLPALLRIVHSFRESVSLGTAEESFEKGWEETTKGGYQPVEELWKGLDH
ncbi:hypothetical protein J7438_23515 [Thalassotalea sp. G20_0]|uniref:hypothetical protein n=1 Tax=Thalassotalea sp. G20_0 TaxID=2821093 RepID=UPI001ADB6DA2|nr:hypothetical protein [Thalassotalea sp. G20_0]MBO9497034.1 hypothetical protein [Thalassotalea sp. G20_0]